MSGVIDETFFLDYLPPQMADFVNPWAIQT